MILLGVEKALIPQELLDQLTTDQTDQLVGDLAAGAHRHWLRLVERDQQAGSESFRAEYANGLQEAQRVGRAAVLSLVGWAGNLLEHGSPAVDLRDILLGPNVPTAPMGERGKHENLLGGFFRAIPFRHGTPGRPGAPRTGQSGKEMGMAYRRKLGLQESKRLGQEIYRRAKALKPTVGGPGGRPVYGERLPAGLAPKLRAHHRTDIYAGMIREEKKYVVRAQGEYMTFRTISTTSGEGWIRKAIPARNFAQRTREWVERQAPAAIRLLLQGASKPIVRLPLRGEGKQR
ncbi:MAG: hypothetical protein WC789_07065 [Lentisphaeria bacterium]